MASITEERKIFLKELNEIAKYTATVLHGEEVSKVRIKQIKKYFNKTYKMLHRLAVIKGDIHNGSFRYGYGGKFLCRKVLLELGVVEKDKKSPGKKATYTLLLASNELDLELVSRIIVEVYLLRNDVDPI